jgi:tetratricopeptide (TPR) repeat protein
MHLRSLQIAEGISDKEGMARALNNLGIVYSEQKESQKAIAYFKRTKELAEELNYDDLLDIALTNLGSDYALLNKLDSARIYTQQAYELVLQNKSEGANVLLLNLGNIHYRMGLWPLALEYYRMSIPASKAANDTKTLGQTYFELAVLFQKSNQPDSAKFMAEQALSIGKHINQPKLVADAGLYLASLLEKDEPAEAFSYYKLAIAARDSMFRVEKVKQVERLSLNEQLRQQELEEARKQAEKERLDNLQLIGITVFIISFFVIVVLLSRRKVKPQLVEFLGIVALLLFFEFINLLMHGWFAHITHHTPVYMLLLLVVLASVLAPLHHYLTHWIKDKLVNKRPV